MKLGIKREKIGDILVEDNGADIIIKKEITKFVLSNITQLTRFQKAQIKEINLEDLRKAEIKKQEKNITVASMRIDAIIAELIGCSRSQAISYIDQEKVQLNYELVTKNTKEVKENSLLIIRGKGKFDIQEIIGNSRKQKIILKTTKWC